jgi:hypothetical protein
MRILAEILELGDCASIAANGFFFLDRDVSRALTSIVCMILLMHSYLLQRRYTQNRFHPLFWTPALLLPMLGAIWLALNVIRANTYEYAVDYQRHLGDFRQNLHWNAVNLQDLIVWIASTDLLLLLLLAAISLWKRKSVRLASGVGGKSPKLR